MKKPREFWIQETAIGRSMNGRHKLYTAADILPQNPGWIHVIEYGAYEALEAENEKLKEISSRNAENWIKYLNEAGSLGRERDQLRAENERLKDQVAVLEYRPPCELMKQIDELKRQLAIAVEALEFYGSCAINAWEPPNNNLGDKAREALAKIKGERK